MTITATAAAAPGAGPEATVRAYLAAVRNHDARAVCALSDPAVFGLTPCRRLVVSIDDKLGRARIESSFARGRAARVVVDLVRLDGAGGRPQALRNLMLLRRTRGRWRLTYSGDLPGAELGLDNGQSDPWPRERRAALRRVADDELIALSGGGEGLLCRLLAPGAPFGTSRGACSDAARTPKLGKGAQTYRLSHYAAHLIDADHARLDVRIVAARAVATKRQSRYRIVVRTLRDTLHAVRVHSRWRLVKPSRAFYFALGVSAPSDVASASPAATWPTPGIDLPSISATPLTAACKVPPSLASRGRCPRLDGLAIAPNAAGGGLVAWSTGDGDEPMLSTRSIAAGAARGPAAVVRDTADDADMWTVVDGGLVAVADGALLIEQSLTSGAVRALPLNADGAVRGPAGVVEPGEENVDDAVQVTVATGPPDAAAVTVLVPNKIYGGPMAAVRLRGDATPAGPRIELSGIHDPDDTVAAATLPDGGLLVATAQDGYIAGSGISVRRLGSDGQLVGVEVLQRAAADRSIPRDPALAVDATGRAFATWKENDGRGHGAVRAWSFDPAAPGATIPMTVAKVAVAPRQADSVAEGLTAPNLLAAAPLPGGGWGLAWTAYRSQIESSGWAARLDAAGAVVAAPRQLADRVTTTGYTSGLGLAGDSVVWAAPPLIAGITQVRAAPLP